MPPPRKSRGRRNSYAKIDGLQDFLRDLGVAERNMARAERVFETLAAATVVTMSRAKAQEQGRQQQRAAEDLKVVGPGTVSYGGKAWSFGAEFGSILYGQFPEWRGRGIGAGYFFWPAIEEFRDEDMVNLWVREVWEQVKHLFSD